MQAFVARSAYTSKTLVNGRSNKVVNIASTSACAVEKNGREDPGHFHFRNSGPALRLIGDGLAERGLRRGQPRDRHAVGRARNVIQSDLMAEHNGGGIAAMLAANPDLEARAGLAPARNA